MAVVGDRALAQPVSVPAARTARRSMLPRPKPWRHAWFLEAFTWMYLIWSIVPIGIAILFSFNNGKSQAAWQGFSWRWYFTDPLNSVLHSPELHQAVLQTLRLAGFTTLITVPLGVGFAIGIDRWRGRTSTSLNFVMIFSFVVPELLLAVALMFVFTQLLTIIPLGTNAEVAALVVWNLSWPAIIVRARLVTIGHAYEEAATDLGASRLQAIEASADADAHAGDLRERGARVRRRHRRLRDRRAVVVERGHPADVGADLLERPRRPERPGTQRPRNAHARCSRSSWQHSATSPTAS